ncbi:SLC26A/SulP transporter family protein [Oceanospirillum sanctuarii]|uniref:SLC26A/SulP transporter family protein n=1 Tax=Oceanospirillum sanctuarii TaxID=1434821 RepID=UPI000A3D1D55|nr:SulP family inorganic anion transporter [Oceanospirillum sanctuarii]
MFTSAMRNLSSGVMLGLIGTVLSLSFASLLFGGSSYSQFQAGITTLLMTAVIATLAIGLFSSRVGMAAIPLPSAVAMTAALVAEQTIEQQDIRLVMICGTLLAALVMILLGQARLGRVIRYLPLPVLAGFLAGVGWLFFSGGIRLVQPELLSLDLILNPSVWLVLVFGSLLFFAQKKLGGSMVLPTGFLILVFLFNLLGAGFPEWSGSWFFDGRTLSFWSMNWLPQYDRITVSDAAGLPWGGILTLALISVFSMLLQATSLELAVGESVDLDRELKVASGANLVTGLIGGSVASLSLSQTTLNQQMGGQGKAPVIIAAIVLLLFCLAGSSVWAFLPLPAVAVVLVYQGLVFMDQWLYQSRSRFGAMDYQIIALIFAVIILSGFLPAVLLGTLITILMFVRQYSRLRVIHHNTDATTLRSRVERPLRHKKALEKYGDRVRVVRLKGFLFFGTAYTLLEELKTMLEPPCVFMILDFSRVSGTDSSTANALLRLHQACVQKKIILILTAVPYELKQLLEASDLQMLEDGEETKLTTRGLMDTAGLFVNWDRALEWCENELISRLPTNESGEYTLESVLKERLDLLPYEVVHLVRYFEPVDAKAGETFIKQGDKADSLYLITKGKVDIELEIGEENRQRLKTMMPGTIIGEMGVYTGGIRTASATAVVDTQLMRLTAKSLQEMEAHNQLMAVRLHRFVVMLLTQRLSDSNKVLEELFD